MAMNAIAPIKNIPKAIDVQNMNGRKQNIAGREKIKPTEITCIFRCCGWKNKVQRLSMISILLGEYLRKKSLEKGSIIFS